MKNLRTVLGFVLFFTVVLTGCGSKEAFDTKTEILQGPQEVKKTVKSLSWNTYRVEDVSLEGKDIVVALGEVDPLLQNLDVKTLSTNGIYLLALVDGGERVLYSSGEHRIFSMERKAAEGILQERLGHPLEYYGSSSERFKELRAIEEF